MPLMENSGTYPAFLLLCFSLFSFLHSFLPCLSCIHASKLAPCYLALRMPGAACLLKKPSEFPGPVTEQVTVAFPAPGQGFPCFSELESLKGSADPRCVQGRSPLEAYLVIPLPYDCSLYHTPGEPPPHGLLPLKLSPVFPTH